MSNVATLAYINSATAVQTIDMAGTTGVDTISMSGTSDDETIFDNVIDIVDLELGGLETATRIEYTAATVIGDNDTMHIVNNSTQTQVVRVEGIETINLTSGTAAGVANTIVLLDANLNKVTVDGTGAMTLHGTGSSNGDAKIIDLSAATGSITVDSSIVDATGATITSGGGKDTINLGAGEDTIKYTLATQSQFNNSDTLVNFEKAEDTINLTAVMGTAATGHAVTAAEFTHNGAALAEDQTMTTVTQGAGSTYYVDANNSGKYEAASDMVINTGIELDAEDFIV
jgi:hypothetical protein